MSFFTRLSPVTVNSAFDFDGDFKMPFISKALEKQAVSERLLGLPAFRCTERSGFRITRCRLIRYKALRRALIEYDVETQGVNGSIKGQTLLGKICAKGRQARAFHLSEMLRTQCLRKTNPHELAIPEALGMVPEFHMWVQKKIQGGSATDRLISEYDPLLPKRIGQAIFEFHRLEYQSIKAIRYRMSFVFLLTGLKN